MSLKIISPSDWQTQPWKNGGGLTHELAASKDDQGILWRLSIAEVTQDGPFSLFPGIDRILMLLEGNGMELCFQDGSIKRIHQKLSSFSFRGEEAITSHLLNGPVRDFNVMTCRERCQADLEILKLASSERISLSLSKKHFFYVASGTVTALVEENLYRLEEKNLLAITHENRNLLLVGENAGAILISITLTHL